MSAAFQRGWRKAARTVLQMAAAGSLTAIVAAVADGLNPTVAGVVLAGWGVLVTFLQNYLETAGTIPTLLPTPGLVPSAAPMVGHTVGTVETEVDQVGDMVGEVSGTVESTGGELMGEVVDVDRQDDSPD